MATYEIPVRTNDGPEPMASLHETRHTHSIRSGNERNAGNTSNASIRVVMQRPHNHFFLLPVMLHTSTTIRDVMRELREMRNQEVSRIKVLKLIRQFLWTTVIEVVYLSNIRTSDVEAQPSQRPIEVIVSSRTPSAELTAAFHRSWLLQSSDSFADQYPILLSGPSSRIALLIGQELKKRVFFWVLFAALLVSFGIGLVVGVACSRADLAVAITGGLTGIISVLTALLVWMLK